MEPLEPNHKKRKTGDSPKNKLSPSSKNTNSNLSPLVSHKTEESPVPLSDTLDVSLPPSLRPVKNRFEDAFKSLNKYIVDMSIASKQG